MNEEKGFNVDDFVENKYEELLTYAKQKYQFHDFGDIDKVNSGIIWRHDVDCSVHRAAVLSKIENRVGVSATYFIMLHSEFYNVWEKEIRNKLLTILSNGGKIGLHFEPAYYDLNSKNIQELEEKIEEEKKFLERLLDVQIKEFSFHNPDTDGGFLNLKETELAGLTNVYHKNIREKYAYCSDSNGYWRFNRLTEFLEKHTSEDRLQVLTHPVWWQKEVMTARRRILRCVEGRAKNSMRNYDSLLEKNKRINIY